MALLTLLAQIGSFVPAREAIREQGGIAHHRGGKRSEELGYDQRPEPDGDDAAADGDGSKLAPPDPEYGVTEARPGGGGLGLDGRVVTQRRCG